MANELKFGATIDDSKLLKSLDEIQKRISGLQDLTINVKIGGGDASGKIASLTADITKQEQALERLKGAWKGVEEAQAKQEQAQRQYSSASYDAARATEQLNIAYKDLDWLTKKPIGMVENMRVLQSEIEKAASKVAKASKDGFYSLDKDQSTQVVETIAKKYQLSFQEAVAAIKGAVTSVGTTVNTEAGKLHLESLFGSGSQFHTNMGQFYLHIQKNKSALAEFRKDVKETNKSIKLLEGDYGQQIYNKEIAAKKELQNATNAVTEAQKQYNAAVTANGGRDVTAIEAHIQALKQQKAELEKNGTATTSSKDMKVEVTLDRTKFDEQLTTLADYITKWQPKNKITIETQLGGGSGNATEELALTKQIMDLQQRIPKMKEELKSLQEELKYQSNIHAEYNPANLDYRKKNLQSAEEKLADIKSRISQEEEKIAKNRLVIEQEIIERKTAYQKAEEAYLKSVKAQQGQSGRFEFTNTEVGENGIREWLGITSFRSDTKKINSLEWFVRQLQDVIDKKSEYKGALNEMKSALAQFFEIERQHPGSNVSGFARVERLRNEIKTINNQLRSGENYATGSELTPMQTKELEQLKKILTDLIPIFEKFEKASKDLWSGQVPTTTSVNGYLDALKQQLKQAEYATEESKNRIDKYLTGQATFNAEREPLLAQEKAKVEAITKAENDLADAKVRVQAIQEKINTAEQKTADVTLHVKLDEWQNVEPQLQAIKTKIEEWSKTNPIVISTSLGNPNNATAIKQELGKYDGIWEGVTKQASGTMTELQKQFGTGDLTQQWKDADAALRKFIEDLETMRQTDASKAFALNTGKNTGIYAQLESVVKLFKEAKMSAETIDPSKLSAAVAAVHQMLNGVKVDDVSSKLKALIGTIRSDVSAIQRIGNEGVSPLESNILRAESAIASSVLTIRASVQSMINALRDDNLTAFAERAQRAADSIEKLSQQVGGFNNVAVNQQGMRDLLTGLGALINNLKEINGGNPIKGADALFRQYENDVERIRKVILALNGDEEKLRASMAMGTTNDNAKARFGTQIQAIEEYRRRLQELLKTDFADWNFSAVKNALAGEQAALRSETDATLKYAESMRVAEGEVNRITIMLEKYNTILAELKTRGLDTSGLDAYVQKLRDFQQMFQTLLNSQQIGGVELSKNAGYKSVLDNVAVTGSDAVQAMKEYDGALKTLNATVEKLTQAQKALDAAIANGKQKGADVSGVDAMRTEVMSLINAAQQAKLPQDAVASLVGSKQTIDESTQAIRNLNTAIKENEAIEKNRTAAQNKMADLDLQIRKMEAIERQRKALPDDMQGNVTNLAQQYRDVLSVRTQLNAVATGVDNTKVSDILAQSENYTKLKNAISDTTTALQELKQQQMLNRKNQAGRSFQDLSDSIQELDNLNAKARNNGYIIDPNLEQNIANARAELVKFRDELEKVMNGTSNKSALSITGQNAYKQAKDNAALQATVLKEALGKHKIDTKNVNDAEKEYNALVRTLEQVDKLIASNSVLRFPVDLQSLDDAKRAFEKLRDTYNGIASGSDSQNALHFKNQAANVDSLARANLALAEAKVAVNKQQREENKKQGIDPAIKNIEDAIKAYRSLSSEITKLTKTSEEGKKYHFDTTDVDNAIQKLTALRDKIQAIMVGSVAGKTKDITNSQAYIDATNQGLMVNNTLAAKNAEEKARLAGQTNKLTEEEQRLAKAIQEANNAGHQQSQILSDLRSMAMQYMSVYYVQQFVKEMANITGELELQQRALEVILGNASYAQSMYADVRELSQMSPFSLMDLMKSTRQLAAFGIEAKDLYGTMRALSDISAGLSVDVNRLILAYGHTRSYGYLSGIQNRQFENAGIDMIGGLVDRYNKLAEAEKAAGRNAEFLTRKDIFKKMRAKEIPFEDVESVVMQLDQPGGKFYNMQEKQFDTLGGKLRNLANNYNIMMSEIGNSQHGLLMKGVSLITDVHEHWSRYAKVIMDVVAALGVMKVAQLAVGNAAMATNAQLAKTALVKQQNMLATNYLNNYNNWRDANKMRYDAYGQAVRNAGAPILGTLFGSSYKVGATDTEVKGLAQNQEINNLTKQRVALTAKLTQAQREFLLVSAGINPVQAANIAGMNAMGRGLLVLRLGFIQAAISAKAFAMSILTNPMMWVMAAVAGLMHLNQKFSETSDAAKEMNDNIDRTMREDMRGVREILNGYKGMIENVDAEVIKLKPGALDGKEVEDIINNLKQKLQAQSPIYDKDLFDIMKFESQEKQVEAMLQKLKDIEVVKQIELDTKDSFTQSIEETGAGWTTFWRGEGLTTNMNDAAEQGKVLKAFSIPDEAWENMTTDGKKKINAYVKELGVTREQAAKALLMQGESFGKLFHDSGNDGGRYANFQSVAEQYQNELATALGDMDPVATDTAGTIVASMLGDPSQQQMLIEDRLNQLFLQAKVGDENTKMAMRAKFIELIAASMPKAEGDRLIANNLEAFLGAEILKQARAGVNSGTKKSELAGIAKQSVEKAIKIVSAMNPKHAAQYAKLAKDGYDAYVRAATQEAKKSILSEDWQQRALKMNIRPQVGIDLDYTEFMDKQRKKLKEIQDKFKKNKQRLKWIIGTDITLDLNTKSVQAAIKKLTEIYNKLGQKNAELYKGGITDKEYGQLEQNRGQRETLKQTLETLKEMETIGKYMDSEHQSWKDDSKDKNKKGNQEDKLAKQFREETRLIKEAYDWYVKWEKKIGDSEALKIVNEEYSKLLSESGDALKKLAAGLNLDISGISIENIPKYKESLLQLLTAAEKAYSNPKHKNNYMLEAIRALKSELQQVGFNDFEKNSQKALSAVQNSLEDLTRQWSIFTKVREATGDVDFAKSVAGFNAEDLTSASNIVDLQKQEIRDFMSKTSANSSDIVLDTIWEKSKKDIEDLAKKAYEGNNNAENVESLIEYLSKLKDAERQLQDERANALANALASSELLVDKLQKINDEYERQKNLIDKMPDSPQKKQALSKLASERDYKSLRETYEYKRAMSAVFTQTENELEHLVEELRKTLKFSLEKGGISAEQYAEEIEKINNQFDKIRQKKSDIAAFFSNGLNGLFQNLGDKGKELVRQGALKEQEGQGLINAFHNGKGTREDFIKGVNMKADGANMIGQGNGMMQMAGKAAGTVAVIDTIINGINDNVQSLRKFLDTLADTFEKLGKGGDKIKDSGFYGFMSAFSEGSQGAAAGWNSLKNGDVMGAVDGVFRSVSGWFTGFAQWHDDKRQRQIERIQTSINRMNDTLDAIKRNRERTLGYDKGELSKNYASFYTQAMAMRAFGKLISEDMVEDNNAVFDAMKKFYSSVSGTSSQNGYQQELSNLIQQRTLLWKQYNLENDKKNVDDSKLQEYISKISELDDQIKYYKDDLLKDLFEIDFSSWADKLSDALVSAFENGEDAVEAYDKSVREIIQSVIKNALKLATVEPLFKKLREEVSGAFNIAAPEDSANAISKIITEAFSATGYMTKGLEAYNIALLETEKQLNSIGLSIRDIEGIATSWYGIDLDSWAKDLSSALTDAFYDGKLAAEDYADTVRNVMQNVVNSMLQTAYLEPMMENLKNQLFGWTDEQGITHKGAFNADNAQGSAADVASVLAKYFGEGGDGKALITQSQEFVDAMEQILNNSGMTLHNTSSSDTRNSITNAATEETMGIISGYLAAVRQDTSVTRMMIVQLVTDYMSDYKSSLMANTTALSSIDVNVRNIYSAINDGDGALYNAVKSLRDDVHDVIVGNQSLKMR